MDEGNERDIIPTFMLDGSYFKQASQKLRIAVTMSQRALRVQWLSYNAYARDRT